MGNLMDALHLCGGGYYCLVLGAFYDQHLAFYVAYRTKKDQKIVLLN